MNQNDIHAAMNPATLAAYFRETAPEMSDCIDDFFQHYLEELFPGYNFHVTISIIRFKQVGTYIWHRYYQRDVVRQTMGKLLSIARTVQRPISSKLIPDLLLQVAELPPRGNHPIQDKGFMAHREGLPDDAPDTLSFPDQLQWHVGWSNGARSQAFREQHNIVRLA